MKTREMGRLLICVILLAGMFCSTAVFSGIGRTAAISVFTGDVSVRLSGEEKLLPAEIGMILSEGDILLTKSKSTAVLAIDGEEGTAMVEVGENSQLLIAELVENQAGDKQTLLDLALGKILIKVKKVHDPASKFEVKTPTSIMGVRGTEFSVEVEAIE